MELWQRGPNYPAIYCNDSRGIWKTLTSTQWLVLDVILKYFGLLKKRRQDKETWEACSKKYLGLANLSHPPYPDPPVHPRQLSQLNSLVPVCSFWRSTIKSFAVRIYKSTQNCCRLHLLQTLYSLRGLRSLQELWILRCTVLRRNKESQRMLKSQHQQTPIYKAYRALTPTSAV